MKKLFVFEISDYWLYCSGGLVILADDFEECKKILEQHLLKKKEEWEKEYGLDYGKYKHELYETKKGAKKEKKDYDAWTLVEELNCPDENKSRIVLFEYNCG